jgi:hypothetical protein
MATDKAVAGACAGVLSLLRRRWSGVGEARFEVYDTSSFRSPMGWGVSLFVYALRVDAARRSVPSPRGARRPALGVECGVLLTPWAPTPSEALELAGWVLATLESSPAITGEELGAAFASGESVQVVAAGLGVQEMRDAVALTGRADLPLSLAYLVRGFVIEAGAH